MKKKFLLLLVIFTACSQANPNISILENSNCELPCWNDISPNNTSQQEALQIIENLDGVEPESIIASGPWEIFNERIRFSLYQDSPSNKTPTDVTAYFLDAKVVALLIMRNLNLTFGELVKKTGAPEFIISMPFDGGGPVVTAINSSKGISFEFFAESEDLQPETNIDTIFLFAPTHYENLLDAEMFSGGAYGASETKKIMYPWNGYGNIEKLCHPRFP